jgi:hypothetical protein
MRSASSSGPRFACTSSLPDQPLSCPCPLWTFPTMPNPGLLYFLGFFLCLCVQREGLHS